MKTSEKLRDMMKRNKVSRKLSQKMSAFKFVRSGADVSWDEANDFWRGLSSQPGGLRRLRD